MVGYWKLTHLQWGYAGSYGTFAIPFGQVFAIAAVCTSNIEAWERCCYGLSTTGFGVRYGGPVSYIAIGKA